MKDPNKVYESYYKVYESYYWFQFFIAAVGWCPANDCAMPSPRTPRGQAMGATNQAMPSPRTPRGQAMGATNQAMPSPRTPRGQAMGATNRPRLAALDRVRETDDVHRAATSRVSTSNSNRHLLPHVGVSPRTAGSRRQLVMAGEGRRVRECGLWCLCARGSKRARFVATRICRLGADLSAPRAPVPRSADTHGADSFGRNFRGPRVCAARPRNAHAGHRARV